MQICKYEICKYANIQIWEDERWKDEKMKIRKRKGRRKITVELMWIEPVTSATPATPATHPNPSNQIKSNPITAHHCQSNQIKSNHSLPTFIQLKKSLDHSISPFVPWSIFLAECILFMCAAFLKTCKYEIYKDANMKYTNIGIW
jgi:hypothetical protein